MTALVGSVFLASLVGSPHCAGMCGAFVCFYASERGPGLLGHLAYNGGRLVSYVLLGALAGGLGARLDHLGAGAGVSHAAAIAAGAMMIVWGGASLATHLGARWPWSGRVRIGGGAVGRAASVALRAMRDWPPPARALTIGLATTLLPCGWLYAFVATAAASGSAATGALVMALFWAGTVPVMAGLGLAAQRLLGPLRVRLPIATSVLVVVLGLLTVAGKFHAGASHAHHAAPMVETHHGGH